MFPHLAIVEHINSNSKITANMLHSFKLLLIYSSLTEINKDAPIPIKPVIVESKGKSPSQYGDDDEY